MIHHLEYDHKIPEKESKKHKRLMYTSPNATVYESHRLTPKPPLTKRCTSAPWAPCLPVNTKHGEKGVYNGFTHNNGGWTRFKHVQTRWKWDVEHEFLLMGLQELLDDWTWIYWLMSMLLNEVGCLAGKWLIPLAMKSDKWGCIFCKWLVWRAHASIVYLMSSSCLVGSSDVLFDMFPDPAHMNLS